VEGGPAGPPTRHAPGKKGKQPRRLKDRPTATNLVSTLMLDGGQDKLGEWIYRLLSASLHSSAHGLLRYVTAVGDDDEPHHKLGAVGLGTTEATNMIRVVVMGYVNAVSRFAAYLGWQKADYDATVRNVSTYLLQLHHPQVIR